MDKKMIEVEEGFFEHLLNCLANQRYMDIPEEMPHPETAKNQEKIDKAWQKGMGILQSN